MEQAEEPTVVPWAAVVSMVARRVVVEIQVAQTVVGTMVGVGAVAGVGTAVAAGGGGGVGGEAVAGLGAAAMEVEATAAAAEEQAAETAGFEAATASRSTKLGKS